MKRLEQITWLLHLEDLSQSVSVGQCEMFCFSCVISGIFDSLLINLPSVLKAVLGKQCRFLSVLRWNMSKSVKLYSSVKYLLKFPSKESFSDHPWLPDESGSWDAPRQGLAQQRWVRTSLL